MACEQALNKLQGGRSRACQRCIYSHRAIILLRLLRCCCAGAAGSMPLTSPLHGNPPTDFDTSFASMQWQGDLRWCLCTARTRSTGVANSHRGHWRHAPPGSLLIKSTQNSAKNAPKHSIFTRKKSEKGKGHNPLPRLVF